MTGHRIKLPKGVTVSKDGKVVKKPYALNRPAQHAKANKKTWKAAK